jgi:hypothetical protein
MMHLSSSFAKHSDNLYAPCNIHRPRGLRRGSAASLLLGLRLRIPPGTWMYVCCECCVLSGRSLCNGLITRLGQSYRVCMSQYDREASIMRSSWPTWGQLGHGEKKIICTFSRGSTTVIPRGRVAKDALYIYAPFCWTLTSRSGSATALLPSSPKLT